MAIIASALARINCDPFSYLGGTDRVNQHFASRGHVWRDRVLNPAVTLGLFLLQILHGNTAIAHLRHLAKLKLSNSSYCMERKRLPLAALGELVEQISCDCLSHLRCQMTRGATWLGRRVIVADATSATTSRYIRRLGVQDQIVEWIKPADRPRWMNAEAYSQLPMTLLVRELRYHITTRGQRTRVVTIATTLLDPMRYPKHQIAKLYGLRWEIETNFRHLKHTMRMDQLKCKSVDGVLKELMMFVLVYNLVRAAMTLAAGRQAVEVNRISFIDAIRWICSRSQCWSVTLIVNPLRPGRWHPRVKKKRIKEYDLMNRPRHEYIEPSMENGVAT